MFVRTKIRTLDKFVPLGMHGQVLGGLGFRTQNFVVLLARSAVAGDSARTDRGHVRRRPRPGKIMANVAYDSRIIHQFADSLYTRANTIIVTYAIMGLMPGVLAAAFGAAFDMTPAIVGGFVCAILFGALGALHGKTAAFELRLQAQRVLCDVQIEYNTRGLAQGQQHPAQHQHPGHRVA